ncbi:MAG: ThiF family adenylyltransferase [Candidatus Binatia bacterium]
MDDSTGSTATGRYVLVGLGGIGGWVLRMLVPYLHSLREPVTVVAVDGDAFEERNRERMLFGRPGPKALVLAEEMSRIYGDRITLLPVPHYLTAKNASRLIANGDVVFCQPDNHATRRIVERRCRRLRDVALFCGGNDGVEEESSGTCGSVIIYLRKDGRDLSNPISRFHPEIARPRDAVPGSQGCGLAARSAPQILFANAAVATAMLGAFYAWRTGHLRHEEVCLDVVTGKAVPVHREVRPASRASSRPGQNDARGASRRSPVSSDSAEPP